MGHTTLADAFFPLALLHGGQAVNFLWGSIVQFFTSVALACIALLPIALSDDVLPPRPTGLVVGACLLLLPLCGAQGLALVPPLIVWLVYSAWLVARSGQPADRRDAALLTALAIGAVLLFGLYFVGFEQVPWRIKSPGVAWTLRAASRILTIGLGPAAAKLWPASGYATLLLFAITALVVTNAWRRRRDERRRAAGLLLFLVAMAVLALALGMGRSGALARGTGPPGFENRYVTLSVPVWCCAYLVWSCYGPPRLRFLVRTALLLVATAAFWPNRQQGVAYAEGRAQPPRRIRRRHGERGPHVRAHSSLRAVPACA